MIIFKNQNQNYRKLLNIATKLAPIDLVMHLELCLDTIRVAILSAKRKTMHKKRRITDYAYCKNAKQRIYAIRHSKNMQVKVYLHSHTDKILIRHAPFLYRLVAMATHAMRV